MVVLDEDFGTGLTLVEGNGGVRLSPVSVPERARRRAALGGSGRPQRWRFVEVSVQGLPAQAE